MVENAFDGIYLISGDRFIYANHRFCEIMGYSAEEIASEEFDFGITLTDKSRDLIEHRRQARLRGENIPGMYEFEIMTKSREIKEVEVSTVKLDTQDEVTVPGIMRDITERKKLFDKFRQVSEGQTRSYDGSGLGLHISKRFAEMMGGSITVKSKFEAGSTFTLCLPLK